MLEINLFSLLSSDDLRCLLANWHLERLTGVKCRLTIHIQLFIIKDIIVWIKK